MKHGRFYKALGSVLCNLLYEAEGLMMRRLFYEACTAPSWLVSLEQAGHFQFLDKQSSMQRAICAQGRLPDYSVRQLSQVCVHTHHP